MNPRRIAARLRSHARLLWQDEQGGVGLFLAGALIILLTIGFVAVVTIGDAVADRRQANAASDSAALAAASYCADRLEDAYKLTVSMPDGWGFWSGFGKPIAMHCAGSAGEASSYASQNGAKLISYVPRFVQLKFDASVRENTGVENTSANQTSSATAELVPISGLCVSGGLLGVHAEGWCQTFPTRFNPKTGEPLRPIGYASTAKTKTRLSTKW